MQNSVYLPHFDAIDYSKIEKQLVDVIEKNKSTLEKLLTKNANYTWENFVLPFDEVGKELSQFWSPISHLHGVKNDNELRDAYQQCLIHLTEYSTEIGQNKALYKAYLSLKESDNFKALDQAQKKIIENAVRDFQLSGVALEGDDKKRYGEIKQRLSELSTQFSNNVLDATQGWYKHIENVEDLKGIPDSALSLYQQLAQAKDLQGYVISLDIPAYLPAMQYADSEGLRKELYEAYTSRASDCGSNAGQWDNSELINEILLLRHEMSALIGFSNYAELSLVTKMAERPEDVTSFLQELAEKTLPQAKAEFTELQSFAETLGSNNLSPWDVAYFSEKLRFEKYQISQEELRAYFPVEKVIKGLFEVSNKLFGIEIEEVKSFETYHQDVKLFVIKRDNNTVAYFYFDLFAREGKRGGAWMADCSSRRLSMHGHLELPVAFLTCNFSQPTKDLPSLLTHNDVTTLFHEFGHGLHHMLTEINHTDVSGINGVAWDAVELPSQFLENWCWQAEAIALISSHYESGEVLPQAMLDKMLAAKNFQSGMQMMRQLEFALFDFSLHQQYGSASYHSVQQLLDEVREKVAVYKVPATNRFQHGFSHIFAGGYAAGYYSYKWAEVLSADAFSRFEEEGIFNAQTGQSFLNEILSKGGSRDATTLFVNFRGRKPSTEALLRHSGLNA